MLKFSDIVGNSDAKEYLIKSIKEKHILHSYLFIGTEGVGKLLIAKEFAKSILCLEESDDECTCKSCISFKGNNNPDFYLINESGENIKIDTIRKITSKIIEKPIVSKRKVYIINQSSQTVLNIVEVLFHLFRSTLYLWEINYGPCFKKGKQEYIS